MPKKMRSLHSYAIPVVIAVGLLPNPAFSQTMTYPPARKANQVDDYHGVKVADPYRWLEDDRSAETTAWVNAENQVTSAYLNRIPYRAQVKERLSELYNYAKYTLPVQRGEWLFYRKNSGLQNQSPLYVQKGVAGEPRLLLDPNTLSKDGTSRLLSFSVSKDAKYLAYTVSAGGSDWQDAFILEVATGKVLPDHLQWLKISGLTWAAGGVFYSRYPAPAAGQELLSKNEFQSVYFHKVGTAQSADELVYEDRQHPLRFHTVYTTEDERFAILDVRERGQGKDGNALFYRDLTKGDKKFHPIFADITNEQYHVIGNAGEKFFILTNAKAPNSKVVVYDPANASAPWHDVIPEKQVSLSAATEAGGKLFASYLEDVATHTYTYSFDGKLEGEIHLPGKGSATGFGGEPDAKYVFYDFTSLNVPPTIYRYDIATKQTSVFRSPDIPAFDPARYESKEVFYPSKDGTRVPMFLVYKKGLKLDGTNPALLYAYGGFNITTSPTFSALRTVLLEQGFVYASANIRGGGEYGEKWHQAGMKLKKQNVFDDFIAAGEWLIANKYTSHAKLAALGASNGGLLMGAVMNQRPDLFRAVVAQAGVMDMLRFQRFTIGWNWIADYGSSDNPEEFKVLHGYSPLHNIHPGTKYPSVLITTADHDDRVIPGHSFKYAATLQAEADPANPVLIRIDTNSGHGPSSTTKTLEQTADIYSFLMYNLGVQPKFSKH